MDSKEEAPPQRNGTPTLYPCGTEGQHHQRHTRSRRPLMLRSISAEPWTMHHGSPRREANRPGRSLTREPSHRKWESPPQVPGGRCRMCCCILLAASITATTLLCLLVSDASHLTTTMELSCEVKRNAKLPLTELKRQLKKNLVGQNVAIDSLIRNLRTFAASGARQPLVLWFSGWEGSGKTLTINIMRSVLPKGYKMQTVLSLLVSHTAEGVQEKAMALVYGLDPCAPNLVIIDGWDEETQLPLAILDQFLKGLHLPEAMRQSSNRVLVVLSGTRGGEEVREYFLGHREGGERDFGCRKGTDRDLPQHREGTEKNSSNGERAVRDFHKYDFTNFSLHLQKTHSLTQVTKDVALVPFLPLNGSQVKQCVIRELLRMQREEVVIDDMALSRVTRQVLSHTEFVPGSEPPLATHGCKRVPSLLPLFLPGPEEDL